MPSVFHTVHPVQGLQFHAKLVGKELDLAFHVGSAQREVVQAFNFVTHMISPEKSYE